MSFSELKCKDVINVREGRKLGRPIDIIFTETACIEAIVVPGPTSIWNTLRIDREGYVIPWAKVRCIGDDVILVDVEEGFLGGMNT